MSMNNPSAPGIVEPLTDREIEILHLMTQGLSNREIADQLFISFETVRWYTKQIYGKLGVHTRAQAIIRAGALSHTSEGTPGSPSAESAHPYHNLPAYPLSFVGRERELAEISALLEKPDVRLITIAGLGGMGKTRLSVEAARRNLDRYPDGVVFVRFNGTSATQGIITILAQALNLRTGGDLKDPLLRYLADKHILLVLDSFEEVMSEAGLLVDLLDATRYVKILVVSRGSLNLHGEWVRYLEGFDVPDDASPDELAANSAVRLLAERVQRFRSDFSLEENRACVIEICRLVDGMPLAIELASNWFKTLTCAEVAREIRRSIDFLTSRERNTDDRHHSIRGILDYTWNRLSEDERRVLRRLCMLRGGFGYLAAQEVANASLPLLGELIDKSLLNRTPDGMFEMHDLLQKYIEEQLESAPNTKLSTRSNMITAWAALMRGDFNRVQRIVEVFTLNRGEFATAYEQAFGLSLLGILAGIEEDYTRCYQLCEASLDYLLHNPTLHDPITSVFAYLGLAVASCDFGLYDAARRHVAAALRESITFDVPAFKVLCLPVATIILTNQAEPERALAVLALAYTHRASTPAWMREWPLLSRLQADLRVGLGAETYDLIWEQGMKADLSSTAVELLRSFAAAD